jgi:hypothetical protein
VIDFLMNLCVAVGTLLCPTFDWNLTLARTVALCLKGGMTEEQVERVLGITLYGWQNKLGGHRVYPQYRLRIEFSAMSGLTKVKYVPPWVPPAATNSFHNLGELPLP